MLDETAVKIAKALGYPAVDTDRDPIGFVEVVSQEDARVDIDISEAPVPAINGACGFGLTGKQFVDNMIELIEGGS